MPGKEFDLGDYVQVKDRIAKFYDLYGNGRLVTGEVRVTREPDDKPRVWVEAFAYRNPDDLLPGHGWSWMELPGTSSFTKGSELENTETSAWGRAIASLGILTDHSIASAQEVRDKGGVQPPETNGADTGGFTYSSGSKDGEELLGHLTKSGTIKRGDAAQYRLEAREAPDGLHLIGFRLEVGGEKAIPQVLAEGPLGEALYIALGGDVETLLNTKVTVRGRLYNIREQGRRAFYRLVLERIETPEFTIPAPEPEFTADEQAELDKALAPA